MDYEDEMIVSDSAARMTTSELPPREQTTRGQTSSIVHFTVDSGYTEKFVEEPFKYLDELEYRRPGSDPGLVVIFNQERFKDDKNPIRDGSAKDVEELIITFGRLGFNIESKYIFNDLTRSGVLKKIEEICSAKEDLKKRNCLVFVYMSHGDEDNTLIASDNAFLKVDEIYEPFANCEELEYKPKLFIFQACKGKSEKPDEVDLQSNVYTKKLVCNKTLSIEIPSDMLLVYSTIEGDVSYRHPRNGTWFIQELCRNITAYGRRDDVFSLIIRTTKCVANNYYVECRDQDEVVAKQMPIFISTLSRKFFLTLSKDRRNLLQLLAEKKTLEKVVDELKKTIDSLFVQSE